MNGQMIVRKMKGYPIATIALGVSVLILLISYFRGMGQESLRADYEDATKRWNLVETNVFKNSVNLETHLETAEMFSQDVKERLIRPSELARNYQYFYRLESLTDVRISTLQQQPVRPRPAAAPGGAGAATPAPLFSRVGYTMTMNGEFHQALEFLHALEHGHHFYHLKDFTLQRATGNDSRDITVTMNFDLLGTP